MPDRLSATHQSDKSMYAIARKAAEFHAILLSNFSKTLVHVVLPGFALASPLKAWHGLTVARLPTRCADGFFNI